MTEEIPAAPTMPACNGSVAPEDGPLQVIGGIDEIAKSVGTVPYANAETSPDTSPEKENLEENRNSLAEDITSGNFAGEKRWQGIVWGCLSLSVGREKFCFIYGLMNNGMCCALVKIPDLAGPDTGAAPGTEVAETLAGSAEPRGNAAGEEEEAEEEDTEEDEVQVIEIKKENSEAPRPQQRDSGKKPPPPASRAGNSPLEKPAEQPSLGKKNDISRHSYSRYNTISYRRIRKGNTKQRIDEFESMMHL
ncbi:ERMIN protein, partial [Pachycephala philippinensis]|nr:ERMIN protein [Pachycephala philippinensis]